MGARAGLRCPTACRWAITAPAAELTGGAGSLGKNRVRFGFNVENSGIGEEGEISRVAFVIFFFHLKNHSCSHSWSLREESLPVIY